MRGFVGDGSKLTRAKPKSKTRRSVKGRRVFLLVGVLFGQHIERVFFAVTMRGQKEITRFF